MRTRRLTSLLLTWTVLAGLYLILSGQCSTVEFAAAAVIATAVTTLAATAIRSDDARVLGYPDLDWLRLVARALVAIPTDLAQVAVSLCRSHPPDGRIVLQPFPPRAPQAAPPPAARQPAARATTQRGWIGAATIAASVAPNTYVIAVLHDRHQFVLHRLVERNVRES